MGFADGSSRLPGRAVAEKPVLESWALFKAAGIAKPHLSSVKSIVGLGNPGQTYHGTRHNVGFEILERLSERHKVGLEHRLLGPADQRPAAVFGEYCSGEETVRLLMPLTMMNESGEALKAIGEARAEDLLIVCDDVNLPVGAIRLRSGGGSGGHHGLQSCLSVVGTEQLPRLRIGVGRAEMPRDLEGFVLSPFGRSERPLIKKVIERAADACETWVTEGINVAMNRYNKAQDLS